MFKKIFKIIKRNYSKNNRRLPEWARKVVEKKSPEYEDIRVMLKDLGLSTVCQEAKCPNIGECWGECKTATIMLMGDVCTRACGFCSVEYSESPPPLNPDEPVNIGNALKKMGLEYVVLTTVSRDDLEDQGANHIYECIKETKNENPNLLIELLANDFQGNFELIDIVANSGVDVFAHNVETVERLQSRVRDKRASYKQSLSVLEAAKMSNEKILTKTSIMLGLGETDEDVHKVMKDLRGIDCDVITFGQYLQPTKKNLKVQEYILPEKFDEWKAEADNYGFKYCASGPLVRSSYRAGEFYLKSLIEENE